MAGISTTTSLPSRPFPCHKCAATVSYLLSRGLVSTRARRSSGSSVPPVVLRTNIIKARLGGLSPGDSRRSAAPPRAEFEGDSALDVSTLSSSTVRVIDEEQNMVGIMTKSEAIQMAEDAELDLVILSPDADPPVVRIMDYNKFRYEQLKKKKGQQKKGTASRMDLKELKMGYNIDSHDYSVRLKAAQKFLKSGDRVKVIVNLKGRENEFRNIAIELIRRFQSDLGELAMEEGKNFTERNIYILLIPNKAVQQRTKEQLKKQEKPITEVSASVQ